MALLCFASTFPGVYTDDAVTGLLPVLTLALLEQ